LGIGALVWVASTVAVATSIATRCVAALASGSAARNSTAQQIYDREWACCSASRHGARPVERQRLRTCSPYVGEDVPAALERGTELGGQDGDVACCSSNLVGSTAGVDRHPPSSQLLNEFFRSWDTWAACVSSTSSGHARLAIFGAPIEHPTHPVATGRGPRAHDELLPVIGSGFRHRGVLRSRG